MITFLVCGVRVSFSFWFFAALSLFILLTPFSLLVYFLAPIIIHECGHILTIFILKVKLRAITFSAFGIEIEKRAPSFGEDKLAVRSSVIVSLAGPIVNLLLALWLALFAFSSVRVMLMIATNLVVGLFNLLPIGSLDGGEIAKTLSSYYFKPQLAYKLSRLFSFLALIPLFAAVVFMFMGSNVHFSLIVVTIFLLVDVIANT